MGIIIKNAQKINEGTIEQGDVLIENQLIYRSKCSKLIILKENISLFIKKKEGAYPP